MITAPAVAQKADWANRPGDEVSNLYPPLALAMWLTGRALLSCDLDTAGKIQTCKVLSEEPAGLGFGEAAIAMTPSFRFKPGIGPDAADKNVRMPINFKIPEPPRAMPKIGEATSPGALSLAREYVDVGGISTSMRRGLLDGLTKLTLSPMPNIDAETRSQGLTAITEARLASQAVAAEALAQLYASQLSQDQLQEILAYERTDGATKLRGAQWRLEGELRRVSARFWPIALPAARKEFCSHWDCALPPRITAPPPAWVEQPTAEQVRFGRSNFVAGLGVSGRVDLKCAVEQSGVLEHCDVLSEAPKGLAFATAAQKVAKYYRAPPEAANGSLTFTLDFPGAERDPVLQAAPAARAFGLAHQIVEIERVVDQVLNYNHLGMKEVEAAAPLAISPGARTAGERAYKAAAIAFAQAIINTRAQLYAEILTEPELEARLAYVQSPAYQALAAMQVEQAETINAVTTSMFETAGIKAGQVFCAKRGCGSHSFDAAVKP